MIPLILRSLAMLAVAHLDPNTAPPAPADRADAERQEETAPDGETQSPLSAAAMCARGETDLQDGSRSDLLHARSLFRLAAEWYPSEPCGHAGLGRAATLIYLRGVEEDEALVTQALEEARRAVDLDPNSAPGRAALAAAQFADLRTEEARTTARSALSLDPNCIPALQTSAVVAAAAGRFQSARESIERALELRPDLAVSHQILGNIEYLEGEPVAAIGSYRTALTLSADFLPALMQLAAAYDQLGDRQGSGLIFEKVLKEHPEESSRCHLYMGHSLMGRNSWKAALGAFEKATFKTRRGLCGGTVLFLKGICFAQLGRNDEARAAFREVIDKWPDATLGTARPERLIPKAYEELARLEMRERDAEGAAALLEEGAGRPDAGPDLMLHLAQLYVDYNLHDKALALLEKAASADLAPRSAQPILGAYVTWARLARGRADQASLDRLARGLEGRAAALVELHDYVIDLEAVRALSIAGRGASALAGLKRAVESGYAHLGWIESDPEMESLRNAPGYQDLVRSRRLGGSPTD
ncbi:MAG TPA: tetratricopeptide repeat protein [Candidatus Polarisedimenticolia bacterium]|jgi:tetratricopeptide (TPR) repeat protein